MKYRLLLLLALLLLIPVAVACSDDDNDDGDSNGSSSSSSRNDDGEDTDSGPRSGNVDVANIDVCSLLTEQDAEDVARDAGLGGGLDDYNFTATRDEYTDEQQEIRETAGCTFVIESSVVQVQITEADGWDLYAGDDDAQEVDGLGDEAVSLRGTTVVRVGDVMMSIGENSTTEEFTQEIMRKMVPRLEEELE